MLVRALAAVLGITAIVLAAVSGSAPQTPAPVTPVPAPPVAVQLGQTKGPVQPINYSHKTHAGKLGMNCLYCHTGAERSPIANLPAVSTCMGCHKIAMTDKPEIQKLTGYYERGEQVPWVEVYRLPDHVKFNHKRHVKAGIQCTECHGKVMEMDVVYPAVSLKMGWCLDCHRKKQNDEKFPASMDCLTCHH
jgi:hypothetical protein